MHPTLQLVSDQGSPLEDREQRRRRAHEPREQRRRRAHEPRERGAARRSARSTLAQEARALAADERGAVTAEYAIVIMAAVAFAGLLVAIMRSSEIRAMLVQLVENALGAGS
ncbi:DUF4244 domain-containing protein [Leucobacter sp. NPDC077196]|uniref:DUF4244 domain-containing protein n=1 Tax=Leucobacter sp. NPDC077196 TaxID=3154959 RepID=UPI00341668D0